MNMLKDFSVIIILGIVIFIYWLFHKYKYKSLDNIKEYTTKELYSLFNQNKEARKKYRRHIPFNKKLLNFLCGAIFLVSIFLFGITAFSSIEEYYRTGKVTAPYIPAIWGFLINFTLNAMINAERSFKDYIKIKIEEKKYFESDEKKPKGKIINELINEVKKEITEVNKTLIETKEKINEIDKTIDELETIDELFHSVEKLHKKCKETQEAMKKLEE